MILRGILDDSLEQLCIRGFAPIIELAKVSKANYSYQRQLIKAKSDDLQEYLNSSEYAFFSEIILSYRLEHDLTKSKAGKEPILSVRENLKFTSNVNGVVLSVKEQKWKESNDANTKNIIKIAELNIPDQYLESLITQKNQPFYRIDGNHRLTIAECSTMDKLRTINVPFCIVLMESVKKERFNDLTHSMEIVTETSGEKFEKIVFYNINGKSTPLTYEQNLFAILNDNFSDEEIEKTIGLEGVITREIKKEIQNFLPAYSGICNTVESSILTVCIKLIKLLLQNKAFADKPLEEKKISLKNAFEEVNTIYSRNSSIKNNSNLELFISFLYYASLDSNRAKAQQFENWVCKNDLFNVASTKAGDFINIFNKIFEHNIKIFVAMPYFGQAEINNYNRIYQEAIEIVKNKINHKDIIIFEIMRYTGKTVNILDNIFNQIKNCSIFIADITGANANVFCEYGYAKGLKKDIILVRKDNDTLKLPFDIDKYNHHLYSGDNSLKDIIVSNITNILTKNYGFIEVSHEQ